MVDEDVGMAEELVEDHLVYLANILLFQDLGLLKRGLMFSAF